MLFDRINESQRDGRVSEEKIIWKLMSTEFSVCYIQGNFMVYTNHILYIFSSTINKFL